MKSQPNKTKTSPGLGDAGIPRLDSTEMKRVRETFRDEADTPPPASTSVVTTRPSRRPTEPAPPSARRPRSDRPAVAIDNVGDAAIKLAARTRRESAPKLVASRSSIAQAPIDTRAAFVLSLVDGHNNVASIIDMAGMPEEEVKSLLERLARLGLITLP